MNYPRAVAVRVLTRVLSDREPLDEALGAACAENSVDPAGRAWLQEICSGVLRWKGRLDLAIDAVALKKKPSGWLRKALLVAAYQLIAQDRVVAGAVVSETVSAVKKKEGEAPARFANACLRKITEHAGQYRALAFPQGAPAPTAAAWASLPEWLWSRLVAQYGLEWSVAYAQASLERPVTWIRARDPERKHDWVGEPGPVPGSFQVPRSGLITEKPGFHEGEFFVQDISSQTLVSEISREVRAALGQGRAPQALDLCAAPGGKTAGLAWNGFDVTATDRPELGETRFALLRQTVERVAPGAKVIARDRVRELPAQDLVWVDAPCSGTGILRRHPDVRWFRRETELEGLRRVQRELLREAWQLVRPGGFLAYSVCSVLREEAAESLESAGLPGSRIREWFLTPQAPPYGDGFWAALLRKPEA